MNNNDVLRRLRYTFNYNDKQMIALFASGSMAATREQVSQWLKKDADVDFMACSDFELASFLNGFINEKRGKRDGKQAVAEQKLTNNVILTKLKIALNLKAEELIELLNTVDFRLSKPELTAFSRKPEHKNYRICKDQVLRNLLQAIEKKYHVARTTRYEKNSKEQNQAKSVKQKVKNNELKVEGARPNASSVYINPNSSTIKKTDKATRKTLKLR